LNILGIYGSPRKGGNSEILLDIVLDELKKTKTKIKTIRAASLKVSGCLACGKCDQTGVCVIEDKMTDIYPLFDWAKMIIVATPVFFYGVPAQLKAIIDRAQAHWSRRQLTKPKKEQKNYNSGDGYLIAVGGTKGKNLFEGIELTAKYFYDALDMNYRGGIFFRRVDEKGAIMNHPTAIQDARKLAKKIISTSNLL
jgi:multimeric flavodoxin WrbA